MKKNALKTGLTLGLALVATAASATVMTYSSDDPNLPISFQGGPSTITSTFTIGDAGILDDLDLSMSLNTGFFSDLTGNLTSPDGTVVDLFNVPGTNGGTANVTFDDEAISSNASFDPFFDTSGSFQALGSLSDFDGDNLMGDWTLTLTDSEDFFVDDVDDLNTLISWDITATTSVPEPSTLPLLLVAGLMIGYSRRFAKK